MDDDREDEQDTLADRKLAEEGNSNAKFVVPENNEPSDDDPESPPSQRT